MLLIAIFISLRLDDTPDANLDRRAAGME